MSDEELDKAIQTAEAAACAAEKVSSGLSDLRKVWSSPYRTVEVYIKEGAGLYHVGTFPENELPALKITSVPPVDERVHSFPLIWEEDFTHKPSIWRRIGWWLTEWHFHLPLCRGWKCGP